MFDLTSLDGDILPPCSAPLSSNQAPYRPLEALGGYQIAEDRILRPLIPLGRSSFFNKQRSDRLVQNPESLLDIYRSWSSREILNFFF